MFVNEDKAGYTNTNATRTTVIFAIKCSVNDPSWIEMSHLTDLTICLYLFLLHFLNI